MDFVVVSHPKQRDVIVDGIRQGKTNQLLQLPAGVHEISLGPPYDYAPRQFRTRVGGTQLTSPLVVQFGSTKEPPKKEKAGAKKNLRRPPVATTDTHRPPPVATVETKRRLAFVAMPFAKSFSDVFHYGIRGAAQAAGLVAVRIDEQAFTGDILAQMKEQISASNIVIADLSTSNPNVYLEVGYAWGLGKPTVLVIDGQTQVKFDLQGQRYIRYTTIKELETSLAKELVDLRAVAGAHNG